MNDGARWLAAFSASPISQLSKTGLSATIVGRSLLPVQPNAALSLLTCFNELNHLLFGQIVRTLDGSPAMDGPTIWELAREIGVRFQATHVVDAVFTHSVGPGSQ